MTRTRALWIGAVVAVLTAAGYLIRRRSRRVLPAAPVTTTSPQATVASVDSIAATSEEPVINEPPPTDDIPSAFFGDAVSAPAEEDEKSLATWIRVSIVVVALVAFFAVSLIATKQV